VEKKVAFNGRDETIIESSWEGYRCEGGWIGLEGMCGGVEVLVQR